MRIQFPYDLTLGIRAASPWSGAGSGLTARVDLFRNTPNPASSTTVPCGHDLGTTPLDGLPWTHGSRARKWQLARSWIRGVTSRFPPRASYGELPLIFRIPRPRSQISLSTTLPPASVGALKFSRRTGRHTLHAKTCKWPPLAPLRGIPTEIEISCIGPFGCVSCTLRRTARFRGHEPEWRRALLIAPGPRGPGCRILFALP